MTPKEVLVPKIEPSDRFSSPDKDIALATLDNVIQEAENSIVEALDYPEDPENGVPMASSPNKEMALAVLDNVIAEAEDDMSSTSLKSNDDYESRVESDLEDVREDTMEQETASSSVSVASRPSSLSSAEKNSSKHKENDLQIIDLEVEDIMVENEVNKNEDTISSTSPNVTQIDQESVTEDDESVTSFPPPRYRSH